MHVCTEAVALSNTQTWHTRIAWRFSDKCWVTWLTGWSCRESSWVAWLPCWGRAWYHPACCTACRIAWFPCVSPQLKHIIIENSVQIQVHYTVDLHAILTSCSGSTKNESGHGCTLVVELDEAALVLAELSPGGNLVDAPLQRRDLAVLARLPVKAKQTMNRRPVPQTVVYDYLLNISIRY